MSKKEAQITYRYLRHLHPVLVWIYFGFLVKQVSLKVHAFKNIFINKLDTRTIMQLVQDDYELKDPKRF